MVGMRFSMAMVWARINLLGGHGKEGARLDGGVVGDDHAELVRYAAEPGERACCGRSAPLFVHAVGGVEAEFKEIFPRIDQEIEAFASGEAVLAVLRVDCFCAAALLNELGFFRDPGCQCCHRGCVLFVARAVGIEAGREDVLEHCGCVRIECCHGGTHERWSIAFRQSRLPSERSEPGPRRNILNLWMDAPTRLH